jgi:hypothetical protein
MFRLPMAYQIDLVERRYYGGKDVDRLGICGDEAGAGCGTLTRGYYAGLGPLATLFLDERSESGENVIIGARTESFIQDDTCGSGGKFKMGTTRYTAEWSFSPVDPDMMAIVPDAILENVSGAGATVGTLFCVERWRYIHERRDSGDPTFCDEDRLVGFGGCVFERIEDLSVSCGLLSGGFHDYGPVAPSSFFYAHVVFPPDTVPARCTAGSGIGIWIYPAPGQPAVDRFFFSVPLV